ncbi:MAG: hypothetical protein UU81_C0015G0012 [Microgenomates group bacterium GW2011_GWC1_41_8]|uniref:Uncharacterized protein n=2 Tax=Candidatus Roizmaniibacteriota TaxID=1752723 RepID=A0A0G0WC57_9BACT|nr:MAG: hypothetical protein UU14_C0002G0045 [Candidatus Roizmanbacteria bacterium GW2011_GWB1_40_7]KKR94490.1 MAG: hypothetical protein UU41_C0006G0036 [Candidatus Roizmanbacteria bacterium GW2011_GWA1_41_13]KKS23952.1 MAG: hypothetical protein UU81_C0015G0012 [Microgenomates group bacterium GW2011_GWC1_41_8]OGK49251.1 MAG: hypothetical protein A3A55_01475 [Candidatus Roizmanbacteria bacterium RIFCSPLOWO2_01_FULL_40_14]
MSKKSFKKNIGLSTYLVVVMFVILPMAGFYFGKQVNIKSKTTSNSANLAENQNIFDEKIPTTFTYADIYSQYKVISHDCVEGSSITYDDKLLEVKKYFNNESRDIVSYCKSDLSNRVIVESKSKDDNRENYDFKVEVFSIFPQDERDIPTPQVNTLYSSSLIKGKQKYLFDKWLEDDSLVYSILHFDKSNVRTFIYNPEAAWSQKGNYPIYVEYCNFGERKTGWGLSECKRVSTSNDSLFIPDDLFKSSIF